MTLLRLLCFAIATGLAQNALAQTISIDGAVLKPGTYQWHADARLRDATVAGQVRADAWPLGAALLRQGALEQQQRLKAGVLFDLRANRIHARATHNNALLELVDRLNAQVASMPVTGRVPAQLNPFQLLILENNSLLQPGDRLLYPLRPTQIRIMGAVADDCTLTFDPALELGDYLDQCPPHAATDRNHVLIIQPDGRIQQAGIALWNEQQPNIAVGAVIYRPVNPTLLSPEAPDLNREMAALLATQYQLGGRFSE